MFVAYIVQTSETFSWHLCKTSKEDVFLDKFWNRQALWGYQILVYMNNIEKMYKEMMIRPFPGIRVQGRWSWCCLLLRATILSTIFIKGMQIDGKRQEPGAVAERAGGHLHAQVQRQTLMLSPPLSLSLFQRSLSPTTQHWTPSGTNTVSSLSVSRLPTSACDTNLRPTSWSVCVCDFVSWPLSGCP